MEIKLNTLLENQIIDPGKVTEIICNGVRVWKGLSENVADLAQKYSFKKFNHNIAETFNTPYYSIIVEETNSLSKEEAEKPLFNEKFPLESKDDVKKAIKYFDYVKPEMQEELLKVICDKMKYFGISMNEIDQNSKLYDFLCSGDDCNKCFETLKEMLLDDSDEIIKEELCGKDAYTWRIIKNTMKFIDKDSVRKAFPNLKNISDQGIVHRLKIMLERLPEEEKLKLIDLHITQELEAVTTKQKVISAAATAGGVTTGVGGTAASIGLGAKTIGNVIARNGGSVAGALAGTLGGMISGVAIAAIGSLASVVVGATIDGTIHAIQRRNKLKKITAMNQSEIIKTLKKLPCKTEADKKSLNVKARNALVMAEEWNSENYPVENDGDGKGDYYIGANNEKIYKTEEEKEESNLSEEPLYFIDDDPKTGNQKYTQIKKANNKPFDDIEEVKDARNNGSLTRYIDDDGKEQLGVYEPCGHYTGINSGHKTTAFKDPETGKETKISDKHTTSENMRKMLMKEKSNKKDE